MKRRKPGKLDKILFTKEQLAHLRGLLSQHDNGEAGLKNNITLFLIEAEQACIAFKKLKTAKDVAYHREKLADIKNNMRQALKDLKCVLGKDTKFQLVPQKHLNDTAGQPEAFKRFIEDTTVFFEAFDSLKKAETLIAEAEAQLKKEKPKRGRPEADPQGLVNEIVFSYSRHIAKPKVYKSEKHTGGCFYIIIYILELMGLPHKDPSRPIEKAIKKLPS
jgi:hypothetical protein